jgi:hypothetical protein
MSLGFYVSDAARKDASEAQRFLEGLLDKVCQHLSC